MEYTISDKAKKVTLGVAVVGLVLLVIGFFSQKDFVSRFIKDLNIVPSRHSKYLSGLAMFGKVNYL